MTTIRFTVPAVPVPQPRQKHRLAKSSDGRTFVQNYVERDNPVQAFKASVRMAAADAYRGPPLDGPLGLTVLFVLPRPSRLVWKKRPMPRQLHESKPDLDNLAKAVKDALTGLLWRDDSQVAHATLTKCYAAGDERPGVEVTIAEFGADVEGPGGRPGLVMLGSWRAGGGNGGT